MEISADSRTTAGVLLIAIVAVEWGGWHVLRLVRGRVPATSFQVTFARAGHSHAGVLVILSLVTQLFADASQVSGAFALAARSAIPAAAILMPVGFFAASAGRGTEGPNRAIAFVYFGAISLAVGALTLGLALLTR